MITDSVPPKKDLFQKQVYESFEKEVGKAFIEISNYIVREHTEAFPLYGQFLQCLKSVFFSIGHKCTLGHFGHVRFDEDGL